ncbi:hypothetical protein DFH06DRAFT_1402762 [Mycena polygramma]|nr:hypothetical protein DFH06DRAFT_1402762 [Mycena polygramma]
MHERLPLQLLVPPQTNVIALEDQASAPTAHKATIVWTEAVPLFVSHTREFPFTNAQEDDGSPAAASASRASSRGGCAHLHRLSYGFTAKTRTVVRRVREDPEASIPRTGKSLCNRARLPDECAGSGSGFLVIARNHHAPAPSSPRRTTHASSLSAFFLQTWISAIRSLTWAGTCRSSAGRTTPSVEGQSSFSPPLAGFAGESAHSEVQGMEPADALHSS